MDDRYEVVPADTDWVSFTVYDRKTGKCQGCYMHKEKAQEFADRQNRAAAAIGSQQ